MPVHIALHCPEIPPNTGNVGRLCVAVGATLHVIHPIGFSMDEKQVRRAGLDYWKHLQLVEHADDAAFWAWAADRRVHLFSSHGASPYTACPYAEGDVLRRYRRVLVPELNLGQLRLLLRGKYLVDAVGFNKVKGKPFTVGELVERIEGVLNAPTDRS